jgi:dihydroorotate dehydrogenase (NAD+) catalytic subunit
VSLTIDLAPDRPGGLQLAHPVIVASGGAGFGSELLESVRDDLRPGAIVTRGLTRLARRGAPPPRMALLEDGLLSAIGHPEAGLESVLRRHGPRWAASDVPVIVSIAADTAEDIAWAAGTVDGHPEVAGVELDLALPGRGSGGRTGRPIGAEVETAEVATVAARAATQLPLIVKLPALMADPREVARAVTAAGADAISAIAPLPAFALDAKHRTAALGSGAGWLSGPAIRTVALRVVHAVAGAVRIPVIGIGGVSSLDDVLDMLAAGASAVGLATAALADPRLPGRLGKELEACCAREGVADVGELVGTSQPRARQRSRAGNRMRSDRRHTL